MIYFLRHLTSQVDGFAYTQDDGPTVSGSVQTLLVTLRDACSRVCGNSPFCVFSLSLRKYLTLWPRFGIQKVQLTDVNEAMSSVVLPFSPPRQHETVIPGDLPLIQEVTTTLREWSAIWRQLYVVRHQGGEIEA